MTTSESKPLHRDRRAVNEEAEVAARCPVSLTLSHTHTHAHPFSPLFASLTLPCFQNDDVLEDLFAVLLQQAQQNGQNVKQETLLGAAALPGLTKFCIQTLPFALMAHFFLFSEEQDNLLQTRANSARHCHALPAIDGSVCFCSGDIKRRKHRHKSAAATTAYLTAVIWQFELRPRHSSARSSCHECGQNTTPVDA